MKRIKRFIAKYLLYIYSNFIVEDMSIYKKSALPAIKILYFIHSIYVWIASIVFLPFFISGMIIDDLIQSNIKK